MGLGEHNLAVLGEQALERNGDYESIFFEGRWYSDQARSSTSDRRMAAGLIELGLEPGDRVMVMMANGPEVGISLRSTVASRRRYHAGHLPALARRDPAHPPGLRGQSRDHYSGVRRHDQGRGRRRSTRSNGSSPPAKKWTASSRCPPSNHAEPGQIVLAQTTIWRR